jgi:hypothetical protein
VSTPYDPQSAPDVVYLRNTGFALLALTGAAGALSVAGALKISSPLVLAQSVDGDAPGNRFHVPADGTEHFQREMLEVHYVNPTGI